MDYRERITIEPDKLGGKPCIRGMRITVYDVLEYLASGMTREEILRDFPYLTSEDITACLDRKVAALAAHRSQFAVTPELLAIAPAWQLLCCEYFERVEIGAAVTAPYAHHADNALELGIERLLALPA